jgi:hypothetical protein
LGLLLGYFIEKRQQRSKLKPKQQHIQQQLSLKFIFRLNTCQAVLAVLGFVVRVDTLKDCIFASFGIETTRVSAASLGKIESIDLRLLT